MRTPVSDRKVTAAPDIFFSIIQLTDFNWFRVRNSVKTVKFRSWKFSLQKLKMGQRMGQYDLTIYVGIFTSSTSIWFHTNTIIN